MTYLAYYWMKQGDRGHGMLCETLTADSFDVALELVEQRLERRSFSFESDNKGRVLVISAHVQYVEIEAGANEHLEYPEGLGF